MAQLTVVSAILSLYSAIRLSSNIGPKLTVPCFVTYFSAPLQQFSCRLRIALLFYTLFLFHSYRRSRRIMSSYYADVYLP